MQKCFFFICPTDHIENTIDGMFGSENYFYTSLGNSFIKEPITLNYLWQMVRKHRIKNIYLVLSLNNKFIWEYANHHRSAVMGAGSDFNNEIELQKERAKTLTQSGHRQFAVLSCYLNKKIKELQATKPWNEPIRIMGKIYDSDNHSFQAIYSDLVCLEKYQLN